MMETCSAIKSNLPTTSQPTAILSISDLTQFSYCPRRFWLMRADGCFQDNEFTAAGTLEHKHVHVPSFDIRKGCRYTYSKEVFSKQFGLHGFCDVVEEGLDETAPTLLPIEFKHGVIRDEHEYNLQVCAQAICLEEMLHIQIPTGAIFYIKSHRRKEFPLTDELRTEVATTANKIRALLMDRTTPPFELTKRCKGCSLVDICIPMMPRNTKKFLNTIWTETTT